ncbi:MAG: hybrid sensor histidine kinase/response regulator, partial [Anaerolineae bacterium]|nr:hybrid sensor histidine kinase/response regulator [Anaerolineae bacterium]
MEQAARILVVDDELGIREGCRRALTPLGHQVDVAADGEEGLRLLQAGRYDLVLLDVRMPGIGGMELLGKIRAHDPDAVCIIITGYASIDLAIQAIKQGAYNFISKPFDTDALILAVNQGLERRRLTMEGRRLRALEVQAEELARAKAELEKLDRLKSEFMLTVAHELRAPVTAIQGYLQIIVDGYVSADKQRPMLQRACERATELLELIDELLQLARIKGAPAEARYEELDMAEVLEKTASLLQVEAERHKIALTVDIRARPRLLANADHVRQLWSNLISNAIKYTLPGGKVTVTLGMDGDRAVGSVQDTGIGIGPEELPQLFREFFRTERAKALQVRGTGLGLAIVKRILDLYGGSIQVESAVDRGSTFTFSWPAGRSPGVRA